MKLREVFRYELGHLLSNVSTWFYAALLFGIAFVTIHAEADTVVAVNANSPGNLALFAAIIGMVGILITASIFGEAAVRDVESGMDPLLYTSPLSKIDYLGGRLLAALVVNAGVLVAIPLGLVVATLMPYLNPQAFGPFRIAAYVQPYFFLLLPSLLLTGAILFTTGVLARQIIPVYLAASGLMIGLLAVISLIGELDDPGPFLLLADPLGIAPVMVPVERGTAAARNSALIGLSSGLLWNRMIWLTVAAAVVAVLHRSFRFAHPDGGRREKTDVAVDTEERVRPMAVPRVAGSYGFRNGARQTFAITRDSIAEILRNRWLVVALLGCSMISVAVAWGEVGEGPFDTSTWPATLLVTSELLHFFGLVLMLPLIVVFTGELIWKEREARMAEIADTLPVSAGVSVLGRFLALAAMLALAQGLIMFGAITLQALDGYYRFDILQYVRLLFGVKLTTLLLLALLALTIHVAVNHKYVGYIISFLMMMLPPLAMFSGRIRHFLLLYAMDPPWAYSDMNGFGPFLAPLVWFKLYWGGWALLLAVATSMLWVRGRESGLRNRLREARARFAGPTLRTAIVAVTLIVTLGGFIFYNTNVLHDYDAADQRAALRAETEKRYGHFENIPQPTIVSASLRVEIYPDQRAAGLRGVYRIVNLTAVPIDSVHVYAGPEIDVRSVAFDRAGKPVLTDEEIGYRIYALDRALNPGDSLQLSFDVSYRRRGFPNQGVQTTVVHNGSYFGRNLLPAIGYQPFFELADNQQRERFGLARRPPVPGPDVIAARGHRYEFRGEDKVRVEAVIGTTPDQIALTSGTLRREWTENGRRYFQYDMQEPQSFGAIVISARYAKREDRWNDIALSVFHHPRHDYNLDAFITSMKSALEYYTTHWGPYEGTDLRLVELPRYDANGQGRSHTHMVSFTEGNFFTRRKEGEVDQLLFGTAHEVAHQWWGGQIKGAIGVRGSQAFLSESLSNYSALIVTENVEGGPAARRIYGFQKNRYFTGRRGSSNEPPLLEVYDESYLMYAKGLLAMYLMRDYIGEATVNTALRRFVDKHRAGVPPYPTALDVVAELRAVTPDSLQYLLTDLFETVTVWDVWTDSAVVEPTGTREYAVTLDVVARKLRTDSAGNATEVPVADFIEIALFAPGDSSRAPLYQQRHRITSGKQSIRITVPQRPARAGIDPHCLLIDPRCDNNVVEVKAAGSK